MNVMDISLINDFISYTPQSRVMYHIYNIYSIEILLAIIIFYND